MFRTWIGTLDDHKKIDGLLYAVEDSSILISSSFLNDDYLTNNFKIQETKFSDIEKIRLRRRGSIGRWIFIGVLTGFTAGMMRGYIEGDDPPCSQPFFFTCNERTGGEKTFTYGVAYASVGAIAGAIIGSFKIKIPIDGNLNKYRSQIHRLKTYSNN